MKKEELRAAFLNPLVHNEFMGSCTTKKILLSKICFYLCLGLLAFQSIHLSSAVLPTSVRKPGRVLLKTTLWGVGIGAATGVAWSAFQGGGLRTFGRISSLGLYSGLIFGVFVLAAPREWIYGEPEHNDSSRNWRELESFEHRNSFMGAAVLAKSNGSRVLDFQWPIVRF